MKKGFILFGFLITFILSGLATFASGNYLHTITLEKSNTGYNVILGSDSMAKVMKKTPSDNELVLELSGITSSDTVNALYKGTNSIDGLVVENIDSNKLKITVNAENIKNSTVIINPINGQSAIVGESLPVDKVLWIGFVMALLAVIVKVSKKLTEEDDRILIKKDIKDREIELYRRYRNEMVTNPSINNRQDMRMKRMLKKIDRKIDERLTSSIL
ncbi:unknown [Clostridium sp. CAG:813]|nr:unknown [Clostridium sp. CAG:813]